MENGFDKFIDVVKVFDRIAEVLKDESSCLAELVREFAKYNEGRDLARLLLSGLTQLTGYTKYSDLYFEALDAPKLVEVEWDASPAEQAELGLPRYVYVPWKYFRDDDAILDYLFDEYGHTVQAYYATW